MVGELNLVLLEEKMNIKDTLAVRIIRLIYRCTIGYFVFRQSRIGQQFDSMPREYYLGYSCGWLSCHIYWDYGWRTVPGGFYAVGNKWYLNSKKELCFTKEDCRRYMLKLELSIGTDWGVSVM